MRSRLFVGVSVLAVFFVLALVGAISPSTAFGAIGDTLRTVTLPTSLDCSPGIRTAIAVATGSKLGYPDKPVVLITSCSLNSAKANQLYIIDPGVAAPGTTTSTATLLKTITTTSATTAPLPPNGWGSLAYRADRADLLACGSQPSETAHEVWKIKINALNSTPADGTATKLFTAQPGADVCDGVTWDASNGTIYMSPDISSTIYHYSETGTLLLPNLPSPDLDGIAGGPVCSNSGLAIVGGTLFIGCDGQLKRFQLDKLTGAVIREFPGSGRTEDLECDPATFAPKGAMWTTDGNLAASLQISAFEIPPSTCGLQTGPTVLNPGACLTIVTDEGGVPRGVPDPTNTADTDGDGLLDCWEEKGPGSTWDILPPHDGLPGIDFDGDGVRDLVLCVTNVNGNVECADKNVKDVFVEFDTMTGQPGNVAALTQVVTAFANAPVNNPTPTGTGPTGVRLHIQLDDNNLTYADNTAFVPCTPAAAAGDASFDALKLAKFGTQAERALAEPQKSKTLAAKRLAFRYGLGVHNLTRPLGTTSPSGCAEVPGNDFIVALGSFGTGNGTTDEYAGTFMHELGHTLGLRHGGGDNINCKPNYLSVMSYSRQFKNVITDRPLDYSSRVLSTLTETALVEANGVGGSSGVLPAGAKTTFGPSTAIIADATASTGINWNADGRIRGTVSVNINKVASGTGCDGDGGGLNKLGSAEPLSPPPGLVGFNDWANLQYNFRASLDFSDGVDATAAEILDITAEQAEALYEAADADGDGVADAIAGCGVAPCHIDIMPGDPSNTVPLFNHNGVPTAVVSVAIVSTVNFDATTVNPATAKLNATPVAKNPGGKSVCSIKDVNGDRLRDLVCTFVLTGLAPGDETGILEAETFVGKAIRAKDTMHIVPVQ